ncbi:MAG: hypothetical protein B6I28_05340 [Fusobacteriia bacterium 4572_132]|nr:MAG: hypothetical protein B6I28_05340 [Fusobacteriia bacterium 4572_132]
MKIGDYINKYFVKMENKSDDLNKQNINVKQNENSILDRGISILRKNGINVSKENISEINKFLNSNEGNIEKKLQVIDIVSSKGIDITEKNLSSVYSTLNEVDNKNDMILQLTKLDLDEKKLENLDEKIKKMNLPDSIKRLLLQKIKQGKNLKEAFIDIAKQEFDIDVSGEKILFVNNKGEKVKLLNFDEFIKVFKRLIFLKEYGSYEEFNFSKLDLISNSTSLDSFLKTSEKFIFSNLEFENEFVRIDDLDKRTEEYDLDKNKEKIEKKDFDAFASEREINEYVLGKLENVEEFLDNLIEGLDINVQEKSDIKFFIKKEITEKIINIKQEFNEFKKESIENLNKIISANPKQKNEILNKTIEKLDKLIMKSDINLYTSMKTERNLIKFSSELQNAREYLSKGEINKAINIVKNVKKGLENIVFDPSKKRMEVHIENRINSVLDLNSKVQFNFDKGARGVLENLRNLGVNHEFEISEKLYYKKEIFDKFEVKDNLKLALLKIMEEKNLNNKIVEAASKTLNDLNGQQLLNNNSKDNLKELMVFNIPVNFNKKNEDLKIIINSNKNSGKIDWRNSSIYFVLNLKKYGETGVKIDINSKNINITVINNGEEIKNSMELFAKELFKDFEDIGLNPSRIVYRKFNDNRKNNSENTKIKAENIKKGFDFKI